jgi:hypothetical protein
MFSASPGGRLDEARIDLEAVRAGLHLLRSSKELADETIRMTGHLIAVNHSRRSFSVREASATEGRKRPRRISGKFDSTVEIDGVASGETVLYRFVIVRESQAAEFDADTIRYNDRMTEMERISPEPLDDGK